jgi:antitoxin PrlF
MQLEVDTSEGKLGIPLDVQQKLGIKPGDCVDAVVNEHGELIVKPEFVPRKKTRSIMELAGVLKWDGPPVTIEEMNETIAKGWAGLLKDDEVER